MLASLALVLFTFGPKLKIVQKFFGEAIQDLVGMTALRADTHRMHEENKQSSEAIHAEVQLISRRLDIHEAEHESTSKSSP